MPSLLCDGVVCLVVFDAVFDLLDFFSSHLRSSDDVLSVASSPGSPRSPDASSALAPDVTLEVDASSSAMSMGNVVQEECAAASSSSATSFDHALRPRTMPDVLSKSMASGGPKLFGNSKKRPAPQEPQITRGSSGYCDGVASWSQETPDVQPAAPAPANLRVNLDAAVKWGRCPKTDCRHSMRPHLLKSGSRKGQLVLMCSRWWQRGPNNSRACWGSSSFPMSRFEEIPRVLQQQYASVENSLYRNA